MSTIFIHVNVKTREEGEEIAKFLLEANLITCANIMQPHTGIYEWEGRFMMEEETSMLLKSVEKNYKEIEKAIMKRHSYDCPPICYWKIDGGYSSYLAWIKNCSI